MKIRHVLTLTILLLITVPGVLMAQNLPDPDAIAGQTLRGHTHMFIAYTIAWIFVVGWVVSLARRLGRVEEALKE